MDGSMREAWILAGVSLAFFLATLLYLDGIYFCLWLWSGYDCWKAQRRTFRMRDAQERVRDFQKTRG